MMKPAALLFLLVFGVPSLRGGELPVVVAGFEFEGRTCGELRDEQIAGESVYAGAMKRLAAIVREEVERNHKFVDWRTPETLNGARRAAIFTAKLRAVSQGHSTAYYVVYWRDVREQTGLMDIGGSKKELYPAGSFDQPCEMASDLAKGITKPEDSDLLKRLRSQIAADLQAFPVLFNDLFFEEIPLLRNAPEGNDHDRKIVVDLPWQDLHAGSGSIIQVTVADRIRLTLTPLDPDTKTPSVAGHVSYFWAEGIGDLSAYDAKIKPVLDKDRRRKDVLVTMKVFQQNLDTGRPPGTPPAGTPE